MRASSSLDDVQGALFSRFHSGGRAGKGMYSQLHPFENSPPSLPLYSDVCPLIPIRPPGQLKHWPRIPPLLVCIVLRDGHSVVGAKFTIRTDHLLPSLTTDCVHPFPSDHPQNRVLLPTPSGEFQPEYRFWGLSSDTTLTLYQPMTRTSDFPFFISL